LLLDHAADVVRLQEVVVILFQLLHEDLGRNTRLKAEHLLNEADVVVCEHFAASGVEQV